MQNIVGSRMSLLRVSELISSDRNSTFVLLLSSDDAFSLVKGWDYTSEEHEEGPVLLYFSLSLSHTHLSFFISHLFRGKSGLFNYRLSSQLQLIGCKSQRLMTPIQTTDRVQKSEQILLLLLLLLCQPTVPSIHLHWASPKSALTASKHWTPSTATTVSIFEQHPPQSTWLHTFAHPHAPHAYTHTHSDECTIAVNTLTSLRQTPDLTAGIKLSFSATDAWHQQSFIRFSLRF